MTETIAFDPGIGKLVVDFNDFLNKVYSQLYVSHTIHAKKAKFKLYSGKIYKYMRNNIAFYMGCLLWAYYIVKENNNTPKTIDGNIFSNLTEKQIVDSIKVGLKSLTTPANKPGILYVSGLKYKANKKGDLLEIEFIDKDNKAHKIDVNTPDPNKKYTVACDDFYATGGNNYIKKDDPKNFVLKQYDFDKDKLACDYIKKLPQPLEIKDDGRITFVD